MKNSQLSFRLQSVHVFYNTNVFQVNLICIKSCIARGIFCYFCLCTGLKFSLPQTQVFNFDIQMLTCSKNCYCVYTIHRNMHRILSYFKIHVCERKPFLKFFDRRSWYNEIKWGTANPIEEHQKFCHCDSNRKISDHSFHLLIRIHFKWIKIKPRESLLIFKRMKKQTTSEDSTWGKDRLVAAFEREKRITERLQCR